MTTDGFEESPPAFSRSRLVALLAGLRHLRVGVIGDFTMDGYWHADMARSQLSRETPLYPRPVVRETYSPGGAANVAWNLADLGVGSVLAFAVFGDDWRGELFHRVLDRAGVNQENILVQAGRLTPFYGKVILAAHGNSQEDARLDFVNTVPLAEEIQSGLLEKLEASLSSLDALVVADYQANGVITPQVLDGLNRLAADHPEVAFLVDSRDQVGNFHRMVIKPNEVEATRLFFPERDAGGVSASPEELLAAGMRWQSKEGRPVCITLGAHGCLLCQASGPVHLPAVLAPPPLDTVGAGNSFLAGLAAGLGARATAIEAAQLAILTAGVTVRKLHVTGTASPAEILEIFDTFLSHL